VHKNEARAGRGASHPAGFKREVSVSTWIALTQLDPERGEEVTTWVNMDSLLYIEPHPAGTGLYFRSNDGTFIVVKESEEEIFKQAKGGLAIKL
jgi:hypothetical protein